MEKSKKRLGELLFSVLLSLNRMCCGSASERISTES